MADIFCFLTFFSKTFKLNASNSNRVVYCIFYPLYADVEPEVQGGRSAGADELVQHRRGHREDPLQVQPGRRQHLHLHPEQVRCQ